ncbi:pyridoxamine 5'-phosphate oxidase family protein [Candidatus Nitrospira allomarina]|uniref:Pyridoxamine 5'-phosphate oxidase family protein n=1 Tax=Candidatus Nitrospira allomarina TaxID=3020900 RepID=A0AA96GF67_9BACT|nr:pyridoxamine 5'-phosphate oxidase family protein [Candidatus Nitrospira allomarina]WNM58910.1 pyridoxamine 5'-phosphate oxidase family protein [Candidatus Nitrospira allomarina]
MKPPISDIAFTPSVKALQERMGSRKPFAQMEEGDGWSSTITQELADFVRKQDSLYLATANKDGRPYIQHRGGPKGFLKVLDDRTLAFVDFAGNRQYISLGNLAENHQYFLFLMDYATQTRIKVWGTAEVIEDDPALLKKLSDYRYKGKPERVIRFHVEAWDTNCRQHIPVKYSQEEVDRLMLPLKGRITALETGIEILSRQLRVPV